MTIAYSPTESATADYATDHVVWELGRGVSLAPCYSPGAPRRYMTHFVTSYNGAETMAFGGVVDNGRFRKTVDDVAHFVDETPAHDLVAAFVADRIERRDW
jgi:hypothetical protein